MNEKYINQIKKDIKVLKNMVDNVKSDEQYKMLLLDLYVMCDLCTTLNLDELYNEIELVLENYINYNYKYTTNIKDEFSELYEYYLKFSQLGTNLMKKYDIPDENKYEQQLTTALSLNTSLELVSQFLSSYNSSIFDCLNRAQIIFLDEINGRSGTVVSFMNLPNQYVIFKKKTIYCCQLRWFMKLGTYIQI